MLHRSKKCSYILKVAALKISPHFLHLWSIWAKRVFVGFWKDGLLIELQYVHYVHYANMSTDCRFLLFWHHNYQVTLTSSWPWHTPHILLVSCFQKSVSGIILFIMFTHYNGGVNYSMPKTTDSYLAQWSTMVKSSKSNFVLVGRPRVHSSKESHIFP